MENDQRRGNRKHFRPGEPEVNDPLVAEKIFLQTEDLRVRLAFPKSQTAVLFGQKGRDPPGHVHDCGDPAAGHPVHLPGEQDLVRVFAEEADLQDDSGLGQFGKRGAVFESAGGGEFRLGVGV